MRTFDAAEPVRLLPKTDTARWTVRAAVARSRPSTLVGATAVAIAAGATATHPDVPVIAVVTVIAMIPAVLVDVLARRLPNRLVGAAAVVGGVAGAVASMIGQDVHLINGVLGAAAMSVPLLLVHLIAPASMGFGDVKAALVLGAALGLIDPILPILALAVGSFGATFHGLATRNRTIAFGPALLGGTVLVMVLTVVSLTPGTRNPEAGVSVALAMTAVT